MNSTIAKGTNSPGYGEEYIHPTVIVTSTGTPSHVLRSPSFSYYASVFMDTGHVHLPAVPGVNNVSGLFRGVFTSGEDFTHPGYIKPRDLSVYDLHNRNVLFKAIMAAITGVGGTKSILIFDPMSAFEMGRFYDEVSPKCVKKCFFVVLVIERSVYYTRSYGATAGYGKIADAGIMPDSRYSDHVDIGSRAGRYIIPLNHQNTGNSKW